jgi:Predicted metal-binding integral membrane protein (DUF2182)
MSLSASRAGGPALRYAAGFPGDAAFLVLIPALAAWALLAVTAQINPGADICLGFRPLVSGRIASAMEAAFGSLSFAALAGSALVMTAAMALPLAWRPAAQVSARSFNHTAAALAALFVLAFSSVWAALLMLMMPLAMVLRAGLLELVSGPHLAFACILAAVAHRASGEAKTALARCHYMMPVRAFAPDCYADAAEFGARSALACARVCWPGMLLPFVTSRPLLTMATVTILAIADRTAFRAPTRLAVGALLILALAELAVPA